MPGFKRAFSPRFSTKLISFKDEASLTETGSIFVGPITPFTLCFIVLGMVGVKASVSGFLKGTGIYVPSTKGTCVPLFSLSSFPP